MQHQDKLSSSLSFGSAKDLVKMTLSRGKDESCPPLLTNPDQQDIRYKVSSGWSPLLVLTGITTVIGACLPAGYNIGVVNTPKNLLKQFCNQSVIYQYGDPLEHTQLELLWSFIVSIFLVGAAIGALSGGWLADYMGRKGVMAVNYILCLVSALLFGLCGMANSVEMMILGRFLAGLAAGLTTSVVPLYLTEISPLCLKGPMGVLCPMGLSLGVVTSQVLGLKYMLGTEDKWPILLSIYALPAFVSLILLPLLPESPKFLIIVRGQLELGMKELCRLRPTSTPCAEEMYEMCQQLKNHEERDGNDEWGLLRLFRHAPLRLPLLLVCALQGGQQLSGINALKCNLEGEQKKVFYYSVSIFESASLSEEAAQLASIGAGLTNFVLAVAAAPMMGYFGRRSLALWSIGSAVLWLVALAFSIAYIEYSSWLPVFCIVAVLGYVVSYGIGLGPIPFFIGSELFPQGPLPAAMALGSMSNWICNFFVGMTFPILQATMGSYSFLIFATCTALLFLFIVRYLPETKDQNPVDVLIPYFLTSEDLPSNHSDVSCTPSPETVSTCPSPTNMEEDIKKDDSSPEKSPLLQYYHSTFHNASTA